LTNQENDEDTSPMIFIVVGDARQKGKTTMTPFNALLAAPDDDTAVRLALESLANEGYEEADLHQIGNIDECPDDDKFRDAYNSACAGEVALIFYNTEVEAELSAASPLH